MSVSDWHRLLARAKQGDPEAEWEVGDRYEEGCKDHSGKMIVKRSVRRAAEWFRRAAEHGNAAAQCTLGVLLGDGKGVARNPKEALSWLKKALRGGNPCAAANIAITYREAGNLRAAVKWFRKAAAAGDDDALVQLGIHLYWGKGVRRNPKAAVQCFRKAIKGNNICEHGRDDAYFYLGLAKFEGRGVKRSIPSARKLFERANVDGDHPVAKSFLRGFQRDITSNARAGQTAALTFKGA